MRIDRALVCRVERSGAEAASLQAAAIAQLAPDSKAGAQAFDGGALVAFGTGRYLNRALGAGLGATAAGDVVAAIEAFYTERGMTPSLEVSPWADTALVKLLGASGYRVDWFRNVFVARLPVEATPLRATHVIERVTESTLPARKAILAGDLEVGTEARRISDEMCDTATVMHEPHDFVALVDGEAVACGSLNIADGVGWLGGAATFSSHRGRGLQTALLQHRLALAHELGCDLAAATALPDGQSASNLLASGFQLMYTQAVLTRA